MLEKVHQPISVLASFSQQSDKAVRVKPVAVEWNGRRYKVETFGLYHPERRGTRLFHVFSFSSGNTAFRVELDPDSLEWILMEVYHGT